MEPPKPYHEGRPWGGFVEFVRNTPSSVKIIEINPREALSLQKHNKRDEFWYILEGQGTLINGEKQLIAKVGDCHWIPRETNHRAIAGDVVLKILEISLGQFEDNDITRLEDNYGRVNKNAT